MTKIDIGIIGKGVRVYYNGHIFVGTIIDETRNMIVVRTEEGLTKRLPKMECRIILLREQLELDGKFLHGRLEERLKEHKHREW